MRNKVILTGRITDTPDIRQNPNGDYICSFTIASRRKKSASNPEPKTDFIKCEAWGNNALFLSQYVKKGSLLDIEGSVRVRSHSDGEKILTDQFVRIDAIDFAPTNYSIANDPDTIFDDPVDAVK